MSRHPKSQSGNSKSGEGKDPATPAGVKSFKKIAIPELPTIGLNDGPNILHIRDALIQYCERELGHISEIFTEGKYKDPAAVSYDPASILADKTGIIKDQISLRLKRAEADNDRYEKSKLKLHGILSGMTTREVDEKIDAHWDSLARLKKEENSKSSLTSVQPPEHHTE